MKFQKILEFIVNIVNAIGSVFLPKKEKKKKKKKKKKRDPEHDEGEGGEETGDCPSGQGSGPTQGDPNDDSPDAPPGAGPVPVSSGSPADAALHLRPLERRTGDLPHIAWSHHYPSLAGNISPPGDTWRTRSALIGYTLMAIGFSSWLMKLIVL